MTVNISDYPNLQKALTPPDLRLLPQEQLAGVCNDLREYLLNSVSISSGHFASGLGTVELTVALHYVYNTPYDRVIWDVGHQAYPHKIITGRADKIHTIRQKDGLHPFPWREESEYDTLSVGHSSTSISAAMGMAMAAQSSHKLDPTQDKRKVCAVIGDGAMTAGMAFEAMNHAGDVKPDMLVVLNDNDMSISENVGALNTHMAKLLSGNLYTSFRENSKKLLSGIPQIKELAGRAEEHLKGMVVPSTIFEELGFNYIGPIDGHDINALVDTLRNMRNLSGPQFLHIVTKKGKGYHPAEQDPIKYHAVPKFDPSLDSLPKSTSTAPTYSKIFGDWLCDMAAEDPKLMAVTPAMREGSGMVEFSKKFPEQYFDVAIAEQHAVTYAAGLACEGFNPVVAIYSSFLQRAYDQLIHDVAIMNLPVLFAIDRAGVVGADGPTHQGTFDLSFMRCIPNLVIMTPSDENECRQMLFTGHQLNQPSAVRYPRGTGRGAEVLSKMTAVEIGKANVVSESNKKQLAILNFGTFLAESEIVAKELDATIIDMRFVKPLDNELLTRIASEYQTIVTVEDNAIAGGAGSGVNEYLNTTGFSGKILNIGLPDQFIKHGTQQEIYQELELDAQGIKSQIQRVI